MKLLLVLLTLVFLTGCLPRLPVAKPQGPPPLPILGPTALMADPGDGKAFLRWNPQIEDKRVVGWRVRGPQGDGDLLTEPACVVTGLTNGQTYRFAVVGVLADGRPSPAMGALTPPSNTVAVTPRAVPAAKLSDLRPWSWDPRTGKLAKGDRSDSLSFGEFKDVPLLAHPVRVTFPDGQELVYDRFRPVDWKTRDGEHLLHPRHFGNGLDIGRFDNRGLAVIVPPHPPSEVEDAQRGSPHPHLTDPMTLALDRYHHDAHPRWFPPQVDGDRVTFHYWQPLTMMGYRAWIFVRVWETWWPIERDRHGTRYHGLARLVEVEVPSAWKWGYQVMLNNGFGPGGSRKGVVSYNTGFREPGREIVDFSGDKNRTVYFQSPKPPRRGYGYHPNQDCLQSQPLIFYDWPTGSLTITARSLYYHCANNSASYPEQGADGVWPSLAWDIGQSGERVAVDTVEYLYTAEKRQPLPQRYLNARAEALAAVSGRMGVQDTLAATNVTGTHWGAQGDGGPAPHADKWVAKLKDSPCDGFFNYHEFWHAVPITVDDAYRLDEAHDCNPQMKAMCDRLLAAGLSPGFWFRPEFVKAALPTALSDHIPTSRAYYGYDGCHYPDVPALLAERGIPLFRQNTAWVRRASTGSARPELVEGRQRDGAWPVSTPYQWTPMSMASGWWDRVMWPTLWMSRKLGFGWLLMDGGFGGLQGVDYTPMLNGETDSAVPCQPFWWRMFRTMHHTGMKNYGECTVGWKAGFTNLIGEGDEHFLWMFSFSSIWGPVPWTAEQVHKVYQLYNGLPMPNPGGKDAAETAAVRRFAREFYRKHRPPDWIELRDLRQGEPVTLRAKPKDSPVAGGATRIDDKDLPAETIRPWTWADAIWHYADGTSVTYPALDKLPSPSP